MNDVSSAPAQPADLTDTAVLPLPEVPILVGDNLDLEQLGEDNLTTYIHGLSIGDEIWPRFYGCGRKGEILDREPTPVLIDKLEPDGSFLVEINNGLLKDLDQGVVFYSYGKTLFPRTVPLAEESSDRLLFYVNKQVPHAFLLPTPHFMDSDNLIIDLQRVPGDGQVITTGYPFMSVDDKVVLHWEDEFGFSETTSKILKAEDLGKPLLWHIDSSWLQMAGNWCELYYSVEYVGGGQVSQSPTQRFTVDYPGSGQVPSLPPPRIPGHSGGMLDPGRYPDGLRVEVDDYGAQYGDELLLTAAGKQVSRAVFRVDRSVLDSGRLRFQVPGEWLQANLGEAVKLTWQWTRGGSAADSAPLDLTLRKPLDLKVPYVEEATPKDPDPEEEVDPAMEQFGFIRSAKLILGAYVVVPAESETGGGRITMHWEGFGETGKYSTDKPTAGNNRRFQIPATAVPANFGKRVKVYYTVEVDGAEQAAPAYGLKIEKPEGTEYEAIQCPEAPDGKLSLGRVVESVKFYLSSSSWPFFAVGQVVRVFVKGKAQDGQPALPLEVIRDDEPVTEDEWFADQLEMRLSRTYLEKLKLNTVFEVYVEVSFDEGINFEQVVPADILLQA